MEQDDQQEIKIARKAAGRRRSGRRQGRREGKRNQRITKRRELKKLDQGKQGVISRRSVGCH